MKISQVILKGVRNFEDFHYSFEDSWSKTTPASLLLMGGCGSGKTTLLKAVDDLWRIFSTFSDMPFNYNIRGSHPGFIDIFSQCRLAAMEVRDFYPEPLWIALGDKTEVEELLYSSDNYGVGGIWGGEERIITCPQPVLPFDPQNVIMLESETIGSYNIRSFQKYLFTLKAVEPGTYERVVAAVNKLLTDKEIIGFHQNTCELMVGGKSGQIHPIYLLSSGEKQILLMLAFITCWLRPGSVVLIDEPDLHLHVSLSNAFVSHLRQMISQQQGQLIIASHAPELWERFTEAEKVRLGVLNCVCK
jgi:energy-coupling factor transporter ATP-binding protein EcfA2